MEGMAETLLTFSVEGILTKLTSLAAKEFSLAWGFKAELRRLGKTLSTIQGYLADVANKPQGKTLEDWVKQLEDIAHEADDVLDEFEYELARHEVEIQNHMKKKVLNYFSLSNLVFRLTMAPKIQKINASLVDLERRASVIGLVYVIRLVSKNINATPQGIGGRPQTDSFLDGIVFGREKVVSDIVTTLTGTKTNQESLSVMAIVGMPGLGKTTLAKSVYNKDSIDKFFQKKIWLCVYPFDVKKILIGMLESLNSSAKVSGENLDPLLKCLKEELENKQYLLVLDDVWDIEKSEIWNELMNHLLKLNSAQGSKIVVTTRSAEVASVSEKLLPRLPRQNLGLLSVDDCWSILKDRAFPKCITPIAPEFEEIGRQIAEKCAGVPLTAKVTYKWTILIKINQSGIRLVNPIVSCKLNPGQGRS